jgi:hypothetical protein
VAKICLTFTQIIVSVIFAEIHCPELFNELKDGKPQNDFTTFAESHCAFPEFAKVNKANKKRNVFINPNTI